MARHLAALAAVLAAPSALAMERYEAVSRTATAVTGHVRMDDFSIVFQNGRKLVFDQLVGDTFVVDGKTVGASVYSLKTPEDPILLNGNRLCGSGRVTYLANWGVHPEVVIAVFTTKDKPRSDREMCASYVYRGR